MSGISTHILDLSLGVPAVGIAVSLRFREGGFEETRTTNLDGRIKPAFLAHQVLSSGSYELIFDVVEHMATMHDCNFFEQISVHFRISKPNEHYHVPLLLSPYGYSTYRGS